MATDTGGVQFICSLPSQALQMSVLSWIKIEGQDQNVRCAGICHPLFLKASARRQKKCHSIKPKCDYPRGSVLHFCAIKWDSSLGLSAFRLWFDVLGVYMFTVLLQQQFWDSVFRFLVWTPCKCLTRIQRQLFPDSSTLALCNELLGNSIQAPTKKLASIHGFCAWLLICIWTDSMIWTKCRLEK